MTTGTDRPAPPHTTRRPPTARHVTIVIADPRCGLWFRRMASKQAKIDHLSKVPLFEGCSKKELERVARASDEIVMTPGTVIVDQGQTGREAFVVMDGTVVVKRSNRKVATLGPGDVVGELSLLDHGPRTASVICETDCTLLVIEQRHFRGVIEEVPTLAIRLLATLASRIRDLDRSYYG